MAKQTIGSRFQNIIRAESGVELRPTPEAQLVLDDTVEVQQESAAAPFQSISQPDGKRVCYMVQPLTRMAYTITMTRLHSNQYRLVYESFKVGKKCKMPLITTGRPESIIQRANSRCTAKMRAGYTVAQLYSDPPEE